MNKVVSTGRASGKSEAIRQMITDTVHAGEQVVLWDSGKKDLDAVRKYLNDDSIEVGFNEHGDYLLRLKENKQ